MAKFPPLPEPKLHELHNNSTHEDALSYTGVAYWGSNWRIKRPVYTADQLRARDLEIWRMAMETAAAECEKQATEPECPERAAYCAAAIRALPEPSHE